MVHGGGLAVWGLLIRRHPKLTEHRAMIHVVACHVLSPSRDPLPGGTAPRAFLSAVGGITAECHGQRGPRSLAVARGRARVDAACRGRIYPSAGRSSWNGAPSDGCPGGHRHPGEGNLGVLEPEAA